MLGIGLREASVRSHNSMLPPNSTAADGRRAAGAAAAAACPIGGTPRELCRGSSKWREVLPPLAPGSRGSDLRDGPHANSCVCRDKPGGAGRGGSGTAELSKVDGAERSE